MIELFTSMDGIVRHPEFNFQVWLFGLAVGFGMCTSIAGLAVYQFIASEHGDRPADADLNPADGQYGSVAPGAGTPLTISTARGAMTKQGIDIAFCRPPVHRQ